MTKPYFEFENLQIMYDGMLGYSPESSEEWVPFLPESGKKYPSSQVYALFSDAEDGFAVSIDYIILEFRDHINQIEVHKAEAYHAALKAAEHILLPGGISHELKAVAPEPL
ncbi:MAG: hypothetical protein ACRBCT_03540 [Alphaproteobacteria bacterium]